MIQMASKRIAFRTDASSEIGTGHFMRCLTLAEELKKKGAEICFVSRGMPEYLARMLKESGIDLHALPDVDAEDSDELPHSKWLKASQHQDAVQTIEALGAANLDWLVVDHYALDQRWETPLRDLAKKIMVIDDLADRQHDCDVLLDQNFYQDMYLRYVDQVPQNCQLLLGPTYALLREEFREMRKYVKPRKGEIKNVLIFFGGFDAENLTSVALEALVDLDLDLTVDIVIGPQHPYLKNIKEMCAKHQFNCHIQTKKMAFLMAKADLSIGAGGSSTWERCCMGLPSLVIAVAKNQLKAAKDISKAGLSLYLGDQSEINKDNISKAIKNKISKEKLVSFSNLGFNLVDCHGAIKVSKNIMGV